MKRFTTCSMFTQDKNPWHAMVTAILWGEEG
jgi:hypothetical protein